MGRAASRGPVDHWERSPAGGARPSRNKAEPLSRRSPLAAIDHPNRCNSRLVASISMIRNQPRWRNWRMEAADIVESHGGIRSDQQHAGSYEKLRTMPAGWFGEQGGPG